MPVPPPARLSKSRFCSGLQCLKQLWWKVHEPKAPELVPSATLQAVFDRGHLVGERAQSEFPGGVLIGHKYWQVDEKVVDTRSALSARAPAIYEASFFQDDVFVAVDILERVRAGHTIVEVKSSTSVKHQYLPDVAIQLHVARKAGVDVRRAELMHLSSDCRFPDLSNIFAREDITAQAEALLPEIPDQLARMQAALAGPLPVVEVGPHCDTPYECPFKGRCWPAVEAGHVSELYRGNRLSQRLLASGVARVAEIPAGTKLSTVQARQVQAARLGRAVVDSALRQALRLLAPPVAYLDFETIAPAIPVWAGCGPYMAVPVQLSCHVVQASGSVTHYEHLAEGSGDPRPAIAEAVVRSCAEAATVVAFNASFERRCIEHLAEHVPAQREALQGVLAKLVDLLPIVRDHVYFPAFQGSFSMKAVAPALDPSLAYSDLEIGEGGLASTILEGLLLAEPDAEESERTRLRKQLFAYCERDTLAMVRVVERLRELAGDTR